MRGVMAMGVGMLAVGTTLMQAQAVPRASRVAIASDTTTRKPLEREVRRRVAEEVKQRLDLTDAQFQKIMDIDRRFRGERRTLIDRERAARLELREQTAPGGPADNERTGQLLNELFAIQRGRLDLAEREQRELGSVLSPVQRAQYLALQEQLRRRVQQLQRDRAAVARRAPAMATPPHE